MDGCASEVVIVTTDFRFNFGSSHPQRFSDDSSIVECINYDNKEEYMRLIQSFVTWCNNSHLKINISKTMELVVYYQRNRIPPVRYHAGRGSG